MKAKNLVLMLMIIAAGCSGKGSESSKIGKVGEWLSSFSVSVKVEKAEIEGFYNPMDKTGMTLGLPRFKVTFLVKNNENYNISVAMINCEFRDGDGRSLKQIIIRKGKDGVIKAGEWKSFTTDTNGYHLNPEACRIYIKPGWEGEFIFDISKKLSPERSEYERKRREKLDEIDPLLKKKK